MGQQMSVRYMSGSVYGQLSGSSENYERSPLRWSKTLFLRFEHSLPKGFRGSFPFVASQVSDELLHESICCRVVDTPEAHYHSRNTAYLKGTGQPDDPGVMHFTKPGLARA
jgi:hypothetical protein